MNIIFLAVLGVLIGVHLIQSWAEMKNLSSLRADIPSELDDVYDQQTYKTSQEYTRAKTKLDLFASSLSLAALFIFLLAGGLPWLEDTIQSLGLHPVPTGLIFLGLLGLASDMLALPVQLYANFVLEERFGFNRMSLKTFLQDKLKGGVLALLIGGPCLAAIILFLNTYPAWGWVLAWIGLSGVMIGLQYIAPTWILPLFNTFTPLEDGELKSKILDYTRKNGVQVQDISVMDGSKRSAKSNAFFTGFGRKKKIALFDTLIHKHDPDELVAVLAHEIGHWRLHHIIKGLVMTIVKMGIILGLLSVVVSYKPIFTAFGLDRVSVHAGLFLFLLVYTPVSLLLSVAGNYMSRRYEFQADAFAARTTGQPGSLLQALKKLSRDNLSNLTPHPLKVVLEYSHPPVIERIKALQGCEPQESFCGR